jgi:hypothetical protein
MAGIARVQLFGKVCAMLLIGTLPYPTTFEIERVSISEAVRISGLKMRTLQNLATQGAIPVAAKPAGR